MDTEIYFMMDERRWRRWSVAGLLILLAGAGGPLVAGCGGDLPGNAALSNADIAAIRSVSEAYVTGWLEDDTLAIVNTLDSQAVLMPAGMRPIVGIDDIKRFWWPDDGSVTDVTDYTMEVEEVEGSGNLAYTRGRAELTFTYSKDGQTTRQSNQTMYLTVYGRQSDGSWRILRRMWGPRGG